MKTSKLNFVAVAGVLLLAANGLTLRRRGRKLTGKVVLITGGSRGLGLELAREFAFEQCRLILVARDSDELDAASAELRAKGAEVHTIAADLTVAEDIAGMLQDAEAAYGRIDVIVNNAGIIDVGPVDSWKEADFRQAMDLMFWAPVRILLASLPALLRNGDSDIVNISSVGGRIPVPHLLPYTAAKFAIRGFSEGLGTELGGRGVHVLTVTPGLLRTGSHKQAQVRGDYVKEYGWFALGATIPGISMEVNRAARQILSALKARRHTLTLTWTAQVASRLHGAFPESSSAVIGWINKLLPDPVANNVSVGGREMHSKEPALIRAITSLGETAAETQNQNL